MSEEKDTLETVDEDGCNRIAAETEDPSTRQVATKLASPSAEADDELDGLEGGQREAKKLLVDVENGCDPDGTMQADMQTCLRIWPRVGRLAQAVLDRVIPPPSPVVDQLYEKWHRAAQALVRDVNDAKRGGTETQETIARLEGEGTTLRRCANELRSRKHPRGIYDRAMEDIVSAEDDQFIADITAALGTPRFEAGQTVYNWEPGRAEHGTHGVIKEVEVRDAPDGQRREIIYHLDHRNYEGIHPHVFDVHALSWNEFELRSVEESTCPQCGKIINTSGTARWTEGDTHRELWKAWVWLLKAVGSVTDEEILTWRLRVIELLSRVGRRDIEELILWPPNELAELGRCRELLEINRSVRDDRWVDIDEVASALGIAKGRPVWQVFDLLKNTLAENKTLKAQLEAARATDADEADFF